MASAAVVASGVRDLDSDECWRLLTAHNLGRFSVRSGTSIDVFPVNYLVHNRALYFRSAPGSKMIDLTLAPEVAFEVDGQRAHHVWSVVVHGVAERLGTDAEIEESGIHDLYTAYPSDKFNYVRINPSKVTGRNFAKRGQ
jgi:nitroimidazol reductase NimA-like FMN-containing flavoprotein (pyridoxamine 5'-phosphate oxidase superfamily)